MLKENCEVVKFNRTNIQEIKMLFGKNADSILEKFKSKDIDIYAMKVCNNYIGRLTVDYVSRFLDNETKENKRVGISWLLIEKILEVRDIVLYFWNMFWMNYHIRDIKNLP